MDLGFVGSRFTWMRGIKSAMFKGTRLDRALCNVEQREQFLTAKAQMLEWALHSTNGIRANDDRIELLLSEIKGKDITELIASGREKLASVPSGGGAVAVAAPTAGGGGGGAAPTVAEAKKEEKVEEKEESDEDMGFSLFN
ncbi:hypothetical protein PTKIN_Ptkin03bG0094300 [Pterospermum kingtungense]